MPSRIIFSIIMAFVAPCLLAQQTDSVATKVEEAWATISLGHDSKPFHNNPLKEGGYLPQEVLYKEYVVPTPGVQGAGAQRIIVGSDGRWYYTPNHYHRYLYLKP